jgi:hypothetical protein
MASVRTAAIFVAVAGLTALAAIASPAKADWYGRGYHYGGYRYGPYWGGPWRAPAIIVAPRPYYFAPPPVVYLRPPVVYAPPPPVYYQPVYPVR